MLKVNEFCNMQEFEEIIKDWAKSTGLAAVVVGMDGKNISGCYNFTDFCIKYTNNCDKGIKRCIESNEQGNGVYFCHAGLIDFDIPITLNDGTMLGRIVGGQVLSQEPEEAVIRNLAEELEIDEDAYIEALNKIKIKSYEEIEASARLLGNVVNMFVRSSYAEEMNRIHVNELKSAYSKDRILSEITKKLYSYNIKINLITGKFDLIEGTGLERDIEILKGTSDYMDALSKKMKHVAPEYLVQYRNLLGLDVLQAHMHESGLLGKLEFYSIIDDEKIWYEVNVFIGVDKDGDPVANILGRDITEIHNVLEQREKEQKAATARDRLLSGITKMIYSYNLSINLLDWKYTMITGTGMEILVKLLGEMHNYEDIYIRLKKYVSKDDLYKVQKFCSPTRLMELSEEEGYTESIECTFVIDGIEKRNEINIIVGKNEDGNPIVNLLGRDITETYHAQIQREKELKAASANDQILSELTRILYGYNITLNLNTAQFDLIEGNGMPHISQVIRNSHKYYEEVVRNLLTYVDPKHKKAYLDTIGLEAIQKKREEKGLVGHLEYGAIVNGKKQWHEVHVFMGMNVNGEPVANILGRNITKAHEKLKALAQLRIEKEANKAKSLFLSNMSHDIRTPINGIMGMLTRAKQHMDDYDILKDSLDKIQISSNHLLSLINDVLDISKLEAGKMEFAQEAFSMEALLNICCSITQGQLEGREIKFSTQFAQFEHKYLLGSELHLRQILLNLLSNAVKYTMDGEIIFSVDEISSDHEKAKYRFIVKDTGIGMSEEYLKHIFDAFSQENNHSARTKYTGTGLGMSIVKKMVEQMGGTVSVESVLDVGSTFTVELEFLITDIEEIQQEEHQDVSGDISGMKVLLVEDNELNMEFEKEILESAGCIVREAENGKIALDIFIGSEPGSFDLILMDVMMPVMNGMESAEQIRRSGHPEAKTIPIIAQTANAFSEDIRAVKQAGMNDHVSKPINTEELFRTMSRYKK